MDITLKKKKTIRIKKKIENNYESLLPQFNHSSPQQSKETSVDFRFQSVKKVSKSKWTKIGDINLKIKNPKALAKFCDLNNNDAFYATKSEYSYHDEFFKKPVEGRTKSCDQAEEI